MFHFLFSRRPDFDKDYKTYRDAVANQELLLENFMINVNIKHTLFLCIINFKEKKGR